MNKIRQKRINEYFIVYMFLVVLIVIAAGYFWSDASEQYNETVMDHLRLLKVSQDIELASNYLTAQARTFIITRDPNYMDRYWEEVELHDSGIRELKTIIQLDIDKDILLEKLIVAKEKSDALIQVEAKAMKLICEVEGLESDGINQKVEAVRLTSSEYGLTDIEKTQLATDLVFGKNYIEKLQEITTYNYEFRTTADEFFDSKTIEVKQRLDVANNLMRAAIFLLIAGIAAALYRIYYRIIRPLVNFTDLILEAQGEQSMPFLPEKGSYELQELARAFNNSNRDKFALLEELQYSEAKLRRHFQLMPLAAVEVDNNFIIGEWNPAARNMFGYHKNEAIGKNITELLHMDIRPHKLEDEIKAAQFKGGYQYLIFTNLTKDKRDIVCKWRVNPIINAKGDREGWLLMASDITEEKKEEERIIYLSWHDPLTGLYNRRYTLEKMQTEIDRKQRTGENFAVIMIDIDNFKSVNDKYGHACGDYVLKQVSAILMESSRKVDCVSRWGGEEFLVVLPATPLEGAMMAAEKARSRIQSEEFLYNNQRINITVSAGVSVCCDDSIDITVRMADDAMMEGKRSGKNRAVAGECPANPPINSPLQKEA